MIPEWKFRAMTRGEINVDPIEGEFFTTEALGSLSDALVREAIQNSLDATCPGEQVLMVITFCPSGEGLSGSKRGQYQNGLQSHLKSRNAGLVNPPASDEAMNYLVIEDFGTLGLVGDVREDEDNEEEPGKAKNDFFYFWRNIGRAVEGSTARGRWGLGKTVFQAASRINSFFALTIRQGDPQKLLMGQSVLKIHRVDGRRYAPYGYYGVFEADFALPLLNLELVERFCKDFNLKRVDEPGLSVVIPFPDEDIQPKDLIRSTIHHYFFPILAGDLVVAVRYRNEEALLNAETILSFLADTDWPDKDLITRRLQFANWCIGLRGEDYIELKEPDRGKAPRWDDDLFDATSMDELRRRFDRRERIGFLVPLWVKKVGAETQQSNFKIFVERDQYAERGEDHFIREGVTIAGVSSLRQAGVRVIVSVADRALSKFLGDSENPAHTEWQERSPKFRGRYELGPSCLRFVKNSPREIVRILSRPAKGRDETLLRDFFYLDISQQPKPEDMTGKPTDTPGDKGGDKVPPELETPSAAFQLQRTEGGFRLKRHPDAKTLPKLLTVEVAYDVRQGNPFKRYRPFDFELNRPPIKIRGKGVRASVMKPNVLQVLIEDPDFHLVVIGFDSHRDLKIKTTTGIEATI